jgi:hypothetical protein
MAKAKQAPHHGTLVTVPAQYPNEIIHVDLMNMKIADIHGNLHSMTIVDGLSRKKTVYPMVGGLPIGAMSIHCVLAHRLSVRLFPLLCRTHTHLAHTCTS